MHVLPIIINFRSQKLSLLLYYKTNNERKWFNVKLKPEGVRLKAWEINKINNRWKRSGL